MKTIPTIDPRTDDLIALKDVTSLPYMMRDGCPLHPSAPYRWVTKGIDGHRLEVIHQGGRMMTTEDAVVRFMRRPRRVTLADQTKPSPGRSPHRASTSARRRRAAAILDAAGI